MLHHKLVSHYLPDYFAEKVVDWRWIIYPWAVVEDLNGLLLKMEPRPASVDQLALRLRQDHGLEVTQQTLHDVLALA